MIVRGAAQFCTVVCSSPKLQVYSQNVGKVHGGGFAGEMWEPHFDEIWAGTRARRRQMEDEMTECGWVGSLGEKRLVLRNVGYATRGCTAKLLALNVIPGRPAHWLLRFQGADLHILLCTCCFSKPSMNLLDALVGSMVFGGFHVSKSRHSCTACRIYPLSPPPIY